RRAFGTTAIDVQKDTTVSSRCRALRPGHRSRRVLFRHPILAVFVLRLEQSSYYKVSTSRLRWAREAETSYGLHVVEQAVSSRCKQGSGGEETFHAVSEAYGVLGDDRKRRAYDRSMAQSSSGPSRTYASGQDSPYSHWSYDTRRRRGATYAWEHSHRPSPGPGSYTRPPPGRHYERPQGPDPFANPHVRRATGTGHERAAGAEARAEARAREQNRVHSESALLRIIQVVGVVLVVATVGGGVSAST
ncbi:uncharacterized protein B0H18DRAFT_326637, partial [Fomitopsis serialis]|uniref:uncharacterized protein n=1 Tax=Fomitopsis serialis TaxID=139415 RepID=UPI00200844A3